MSAVTSPFGSSSAKQSDWSVLKRFRRILLLPDGDQAGEKYVKQVYDILMKENRHAQIDLCRLPFSEKGGDVVDWIQQELPQDYHWDGFSPIDASWTASLRKRLEETLYHYRRPACKAWPSSHTSLFDDNPQPLMQELLMVKKPPMDYFPAPFRQWALHRANAMQVPVDFLAIPLLVMLGSLIGRKRAISPSPSDDEWIETPNNYGMIIGRPSVMKSPALSRTISFLHQLDQQGRKEYAKAYRDYQQQLSTYKKKSLEKESQSQQLSSEAIRNQSIDYDAHDQYLDDPPQKPICKRYKTEDTTTQKLAHLLMENPQGLLVHRDELSGLLSSLDKRGNEGDRAFYLEGWNGKNDYTIDRIGRGTLYLPALCLSLLGTIQPGPLTHYVAEAVGRGGGNDGFLQRFQLSVWPDLPSDLQDKTTTPHPQFKKQIRQICHQFSQLEFDAHASEQYQPVVLPFSQKAQLFFDSWRSHFERRLRGEELPDYLVCHLTKYRKTLPTLALLFALMESPAPHAVQVVEAEHVTAAIHWCDYLESHAQRIYHSGMESCRHASARELLKHIQKGELENGFTQRIIYNNKQWSRLRTREQVASAIDILETLGWIRGKSEQVRGRPSEKYYIHPNAAEVEPTCPI